MERIKAKYPDASNLRLLVNREEELLLLLDNRHVKFEKTNLSFLDQFQLTTECPNDIHPSAVIRQVFPHYDELYCNDISSIEDCGDHYLITIHQECPVHFGSFKLHKKG